MKRLFFVFLILLSLPSFGQKQVKIPGIQDSLTQLFMGYSIHLRPTTDGRYTYDILQGENLLLRQLRNPFVSGVSGLRKRGDAFTLGRWFIQQLHSGGHQISILQRPIPLPVAQQLAIDPN